MRSGERSASAASGLYGGPPPVVLARRAEATDRGSKELSAFLEGDSRSAL